MDDNDENDPLLYIIKEYKYDKACKPLKRHVSPLCTESFNVDDNDEYDPLFYIIKENKYD